MCDDLLGDEVDSKVANSLPECSAQYSFEIAPDRMLEVDDITNQILLQITNDLATQLKACEEIVNVCYLAYDFVPTFSTDEQLDKLWRTLVIPTLDDWLTLDLNARLLISKSFTAIRNLAEVIRVCFEVMRKSKGCTWAIEIGRKRIKEAMEEYEDCANKSQTLNDGAIKIYDEHSKIFEIIEPATYVETEAKYEGESVKSLLGHISNINKLMRTGVSAYQPLAKILTIIKSKVSPYVDLLDTCDESDFLLFGIELVKEAEFLNKYLISAHKMMKTKDDPSDIEH